MDASAREELVSICIASGSFAFMVPAMASSCVQEVGVIAEGDDVERGDHDRVFGFVFVLQRDAGGRY